MTDALRLIAGRVTDASALDLAHEPVPAEQVVAGAPATGHEVLDESAGRTIGVWEMTAGAMRDVEADEVFIVLTGDATVDFVDPPGPSVELRPGSIARLASGMHTVWTVREPLRKLYVTP
jgi:uncharacterized cupin superfamily protein